MNQFHKDCIETGIYGFTVFGSILIVYMTLVLMFGD